MTNNNKHLIKVFKELQEALKNKGGSNPYRYIHNALAETAGAYTAGEIDQDAMKELNNLISAIAKVV